MILFVLTFLVNSDSFLFAGPHDCPVWISTDEMTNQEMGSKTLDF